MNEDTKKFFEKLAGASREEEFSDENEEEMEFEPKLTKIEKVKVHNEESDNEEEKDDFFEEGEGSLAIDVFQTENDIIIMAPIAGVAVDDLDIDITPDSVTIRGKREKKEKIEKKDFLYQECYWGKFSRSIILPQEINPDHATAAFKSGVLKIVLPKLNKSKVKKMKIKFE